MPKTGHTGVLEYRRSRPNPDRRVPTYMGSQGSPVAAWSVRPMTAYSLAGWMQVVEVVWDGMYVHLNFGVHRLDGWMDSSSSRSPYVFPYRPSILDPWIQPGKYFRTYYYLVRLVVQYGSIDGCIGPGSLPCQGLHFSLWPSPRPRAHCRSTSLSPSLFLLSMYSSNSPSSSRCGNAFILLGRLHSPFLQVLQPVACFYYNPAFLPSPLTCTPPSNLSRPVCTSALSLPHTTSPSARSARYPPVRPNPSEAIPGLGTTPCSLFRQHFALLRYLDGH